MIKVTHKYIIFSGIRELSSVGSPPACRQAGTPLKTK